MRGKKKKKKKNENIRNKRNYLASGSWFQHIWATWAQAGGQSLGISGLKKNSIKKKI